MPLRETRRYRLSSHSLIDAPARAQPEEQHPVPKSPPTEPKRFDQTLLLDRDGMIQSQLGWGLWITLPMILLPHERGEVPDEGACPQISLI